MGPTWEKMQEIELALFVYHRKLDRWPQKIEEILAVENELGPQLRKSLFDEWGAPFAYRIMYDRYEVRSAGPDKKLFTKDDLVCEDQLVPDLVVDMRTNTTRQTGSVRGSPPTW